MSLSFHRFMDAQQFARELDTVRAYRGVYVGDGLLESLEETRLLIPRLRMRLPDEVARRFWLIGHEHPRQERVRDMKFPVEPDGPRWDAAVELTNALHRWQKFTVYGSSPHPFDDIDARFAEFIERPCEVPFRGWMDMRVDVSNNVETKLYDSRNVDAYYTTWQVLLAAEVADAGVHFRINLADADTHRAAWEGLDEGKAPAGRASFSFMPVHAARGFRDNEKALDGVVWFAEERSRALVNIAEKMGGRRRFSDAEATRYEQATEEAAKASAARYHISLDDLIDLVRFLAERWSEWNRNGRPLIADAYKDFMGAAIILARRLGRLSFADMKERVGQVDGWFKPILEVIWPDWAQEEKDRARRTLQSALAARQMKVSDADIEAFVEFLAANGLEGFFWRLRSFEDHVLRGNEFAPEGMKSDLQGMALAVEHIAAALGATETQLDSKFKQLWQDTDVTQILKRGDVSQLARQKNLAQDWRALKARIDAFRSEAGGQIAADLVMTYRVRGGAHAILPEKDEQEMEALFLTLIRAALFTFVEVRKRQPNVSIKPVEK